MQFLGHLRVVGNVDGAVRDVPLQVRVVDAGRVALAGPPGLPAALLCVASVCRLSAASIDGGDGPTPSTRVKEGRRHTPRASSRPPGRAGPPGRTGSRPSSPAPRAKKTRRTVVSDDATSANAPSRKVRKVSDAPKPENVKTRSTRKKQSGNKAEAASSQKKKSIAPNKWEDIFTARDSANFEKSLGEARESIASGESERNILRQLQTSGWNAKQSRYIVNEAGLN